MMSRSKTLVMLTPAFPANEKETDWVTTQQLFVRTFKEQFPSLKIIVLSFYYPERVGTYGWRGLQVISFNGKNGSQRKLKRIFFWKDVWKKLKALRKDNDLIGLFSFWCGECALIGHYFGRRYGLPHYCWLCGQDARATNKLVKLIRPRPQELIAMSDFLVREFERNHGIRPQHMIPNGIDPGLYPVVPARGGARAHWGEREVEPEEEREGDPAEEREGDPAEEREVEPAEEREGDPAEEREGDPAEEREGDPAEEREIDVLGVGSLSWLKQYDVFVEIAGVLRTSFPGVRAVICGDGEARTELEELIEQRRLTSHVTLKGQTPHKEVLSLMQRTKILLHTSNYEGFGVVCLEALYAGAHVISFCRPMEQDIPHWHIVGSMEEMIEKTKTILRDPATSHTPVLPYTMSNTVRSVMELFTR
jgi:glycosyltransferase involved in cell wall biosynthesis